MVRGGLKPKQMRRKNIEPDFTYKSVVVSKFVNKLNFKGKKTVAEKIFYDAMEIIKKRTGENPFEVFDKAIESVRPLIEVRPRRVGGATFQIPVEVSRVRSVAIATNWLIQFSQQRKGKPMAECLADEILAASKKEGSAIKKREDTHKMAEANKAFAHYRW